MFRKISTLTLIYIIGIGGIIVVWLINPDVKTDKVEETKPKERVKAEEKKLPLKTVIDSVEVSWYGHSTFRVKSGEASVFIDPYKIERAVAADLVLITHDHFDHLDLPSVEAVSDGNTTVIAPKIAAQKIPKSDFGIEIISEGQTFNRSGISVTSVPAYNRDKSYHPKGEGVGYILTIAGKRIYHAGDTDLIEEMKNLNNIDIALLPIGGTFTMDEQEAAEAVKVIKPKIAIPMHYGTLPEVLGNPEKFKELAGDFTDVQILRKVK